MSVEELLKDYEISDSRRLNILSEDTREVLKILLQKLEVGVGLFELGESFRALFLNEAFFESVKYSKEKYQQYTGDIYTVLQEKDRPAFREYVRDKSSRREEIDYVIKGYRGDGSCGHFRIKGVYVENTMTQKPIYLAVISDITAKVEIENQMQELQKKNAELLLLQERYKILEATAQGLLFEYYPSTDTMIFSYNLPNNKKRKEIENYSEYSKTTPLVHSSHIAMFRKALMEACTKEVDGSIEYMSTVSGGGYRWHHTDYKSVVGFDGKIASVIGRIRDIHDAKMEKDDLNYKAERDGLTRVYRKEVAFGKMQECLDETPLAEFQFMIVDLDDFKQINDDFGHKYGDNLLKDVAQELVLVFGETSIVGRFGGDEFIVLVKDMNQEEIVRKLEYLKPLSKFCAGIAKCRPGEPIRDTFERADKVMYDMKNAGKNQISFAPEE